MKATASIVLLLSLAISVFSQTSPSVSPDSCPADVTWFEIHGDRWDMYALITLKNRGAKSIKGVEYQFDDSDPELRVFLARYYLTAGKTPADDTGLGKPVAPGQTKPLHGYVSRRLAYLHSHWRSDGRFVKINVLHFTDGTKWERKGWRDENPN